MHRRSIALSAAAILGVGGLAATFALAPAPAAQAASVSWPAHAFAPYVDGGMGGTTLTSVASEYGTKYFTLAFVDGAGCQWSLPNESSWQSQISSLQSQGGDVSVSFGGYTTDSNGTDLGAACSTAGAMASQVEGVVNTLGVSHLDFDIESNELTNSADVTRTAQALAQVRSWASSNGKALTISYTIPALPSGLTSSGTSLLSNATSNGFTPDIVNIMTMDYGSSGTEMGSAANQALDATAGQVASAFGISTSAAYARLGNTPMIGQNDSPGEIFTLSDASSVESHAASEGIALLSFWSEGRDNGGCPGQASASSTCSGVSQGNGAFTQAFQPFTSGSSGGTTNGGTTNGGTTNGGTTNGGTTTGGSTTGGGGTGCSPAWSSSATYTAGNEVSYNGHNWTANQWNYNEVPGGSAGAWNDSGAC